MADPTMDDLQIFYSGGGSNSDTTLSIGGAISSARVYSQSFTAPTTLGGVGINDGGGNGVGDGTLTYNAETGKLYWKPYGGQQGTGIDVSAGGDFTIQGASNGGWIGVTVTPASLPNSTISNTITVSNRTEKFFLSQTKAESSAGVTKYHCFAIKNTHATDSIVNLWGFISANTPGQDAIALYLDPLASSNGAVGPTAVADENTAPAASTFVVPDAWDHADALDFGTIPAGECRFFWIRQTTPAGVTAAYLSNTFKLGLRFEA